MDFDDRFELYHEDAARIWIWKLLKAAPSELAPWVSTYRDGRSCTIIDRLQGSFNVSYVVRFDEDGLCWVVRFPMPGRVMSLDEKTRAEVATMRFIKAKTSIPVPDIITWGLSAENPLQLGPWIIMEHIKGEPLNTFVEAPRTSGSSPILRPDIPPEDLEIIYRQWARWQLELSRHHFQCIGSMDDEYVPRFRPMTIKTNEIESHGGVRVACGASTTFASTTEYFNYVIKQDFQHLRGQPNSIDDEDDARDKYRYLKDLQKSSSRFVSERYDKCQFTIFCEDWRYGNWLVNDYKELKIVAVLDWEFSGPRPFQMLYSPPRWLLCNKPIEWGRKERLDLTRRYEACFQIYLRVLQEEERNMELVQAGPRMSTLMQTAMDDGTFWFHEIIHSSFNGAKTAAWTALCEKFQDICGASAVPEDEVDAFAKRKVAELAMYEQKLKRFRSDRDRMLEEAEVKK